MTVDALVRLSVLTPELEEHAESNCEVLCFTTAVPLAFDPANEPVTLPVPPLPGSVTLIGVPIAALALEKVTELLVALPPVDFHTTGSTGGVKLPSDVQLAVMLLLAVTVPPVMVTPPDLVVPLQETRLSLSVIVVLADDNLIPGLAVRVPENPQVIDPLKVTVE